MPQTLISRSPKTRMSGKHWKNVYFPRQALLKINLYRPWILTLASLPSAIKGKSADFGLPFGKLVRICVRERHCFCYAKQSQSSCPEELTVSGWIPPGLINTINLYESTYSLVSKDTNAKPKRVTQVKNYEH